MGEQKCEHSGVCWKGLFAALWFVGSTGLVALPVHASPFAKGPYVQNVSESSITLMWHVERPMPARVVVTGPIVRRIEVEPDDIPEVVVTQLASNTRYRYAVTIGETSARGEFTTAPTSKSPFSFIVYGDSRSNPSAHRRVVERIRSEVSDFLLGTGDIVNEGHSERDWQIFFDIERDLLRDNVLYPSIGNHDRQGRGRTADNYRKYFSLPENSPDPERYYAFTYGNARFLVLDSNAYSFALTDQTAWLEQQLQAAHLNSAIEHIFVSMHHPPYSVSLHGGQSDLREVWTPLFERYQVAAVFSGHDHVYSRAENNGVRYFVSGGGGAPLYPRKQRPDKRDLAAIRYFEATNHYLRVHVIGSLIEVRAVRADGTPIETVSWGRSLERAAPVVAAISVVGSQSAEESRPPVRSASSQKVAREPQPSSGLDFFGGLGVFVMVSAGGALLLSLRR